MEVCFTALSGRPISLSLKIAKNKAERRIKKGGRNNTDTER